MNDDEKQEPTIIEIHLKPDTPPEIIAELMSYVVKPDAEEKKAE